MSFGLKPVKPPGTTVYLTRAKAVGSASFDLYDPLENVDASGLLQPIADAADLIYGTCMEADFTATAAEEFLVCPSQKGMIWEARASGTPTQAQIGDQVDFGAFTSGAMTVDTSATANGQVNFIGLREFNDAFGSGDDILVSITDAFNSWMGS